MKRIAVLCAAFTLAFAGSVRAQGLTMQMSNGWTFTFTGNVNAFYVYEKETNANGEARVSPPGGILGEGGQGSTIRTGLLPTFAIFEAAGREKETDLKVHFGFAPQIQTPGGHDNFGNGTQAGAQIDMRQVYMTVGGEWGQILAGREIGVYQRQNILNDQTLFGTGATGGNFLNPGGTTLGRIGFGYVYPNFVAQITYSSPAGRPGQVTIGIFNPSTNSLEFDDDGTLIGGFNELVLPRAEGEFTYTVSDLMIWGGGLLQYQEDTFLDESEVAWGGHGGFRYGTDMFSIVGSGYYGEGIGTTLMFLNGRTATAGSTELRTSYGFIGQATVTPTGSDVTFGFSYGDSSLDNAGDEADFTTHNRSANPGVYYQATQSLKVVAEGTYAWTDDGDSPDEKNASISAAVGLMLFF